MKITKPIIGNVPQHRIDMKNLRDKTDVLVVGGGGREHAIVRALMRSKYVGKIYGAPGNAGMGVEETGIGATDIDGVTAFLAQHPDVGLTVVAPDDPLALGMVDKLEAVGHRAFGPKRASAKLEWSKAYAKEFMKRYGIPTAEYATFKDAHAAHEYMDKCDIPVVLKADGLALGKGVIICDTREAAHNGVDEIMTDKKFGDAGSTLVVERFLTGYEVSLLAFVDGKHYSLMPTSCDHKRAFDGDKGLNTGGMGAYSPCPRFDKKLEERVERDIVRPTVEGMQKEGAPFKGVLYFGLMVSDDNKDVRVLEYNARFGDPETQSVLPLLESDLFEIFEAVIDGRLNEIDVKWSNKRSINVVLASGGYPVAYKKGAAIVGLDEVTDGATVYFAGVKRGENGLVTNGGRVLCVQAMADTFAAAKKTVYDNIEKIKFDDCFYRHDIGKNL